MLLDSYQSQLPAEGFPVIREIRSTEHRGQSRSQSPRYPCPAERENEDLWDTVF